MKTMQIDNANDKPIAGMRWRKSGYRYMVRSDGGGLSTKTDHVSTLTDARKVAKQRAKQCTWAEIFRWSENAVMIKPVFIASYDWSEPS